MPELPEVESVCRGMNAARLQAPVEEVWRSALPLRIGKAWQEEGLEALTPGTDPGRVTRRGKYILWAFEGSTLLIHLGMSGRILICSRDERLAPHTHMCVTLADHRDVRFIDPRRFGGVKFGRSSTLWESPPLATLGPEPLDLTGEALEARAGHSKRVLRDVLLDQRVLAGVGNIYAVEALFLAELHPLLEASRLRASAWARLAAAIRSVISSAIEHGGTTFRDYRDASGAKGGHQHALWVYGRAGEPCRRCGTTLVGFTHQGRSGVFCPHDQKRPRSRRVV